MTDESFDMTTIEGCLGWGLFLNPSERGRLEAELGELRRHAAAWRRLCAIDKERAKTHRRPMLPLGVMQEVNRVALGHDEPSGKETSPA